MDPITLVQIVLSFLVVLGLYVRISKWSRPGPKLPPGPYSFPVIGNILQLAGQNPHQYLAKLSKTYGPLMHLKIGSLTTIVVSSPELAREVLQKHDQVLSSRHFPVAVHTYDHHSYSIVYLPTGEKWRKLRKLCREQMFSTRSLDASHGLRRDKLQKLCDYVHECSVNGRVVDIGEVVYLTSLNLMSATLFSLEFAKFDSGLTHEIKEVVRELLKLTAAPSLIDLFPFLEVVDPQGIKKRAEHYAGKMLSMVDDIISQRLESRAAAGSDYLRKDDLLETLLDPHGHGNDQHGLSREDIRHLFMDLVIGGSDTTANSVEWAMTELLRSPEKMFKAKDELRNVIGESNHIEESDISRLPYLGAVIKEALRLHPAGPLLVPHKAEVDVEINGYVIPKGAQIIVNAWAIGRHSSLWSNPNSFEPKRFLGNEIDYKGQDFGLIPFGAGRRMCPGIPLAHRMLHLTLASLIHNFDWKLEGGVNAQDLDNKEKFGLTLHKAVPLKAVPCQIFRMEVS